jgi:hypothetical protein
MLSMGEKLGEYSVVKSVENLLDVSPILQAQAWMERALLAHRRCASGCSCLRAFNDCEKVAAFVAWDDVGGVHGSVDAGSRRLCPVLSAGVGDATWRRLRAAWSLP